MLWGLSELGGRTVDWRVALAAVVAGLAFGFLALRHARAAAHPLLSLAPLRHRTYRLTSGSSTIFIRQPITTLLFVLPILLQTGFGMTPFLAGLLFLGHSGGDLLMKLFTTRLFRRFGYRTMLLTCVTGMAVAIGATALFTRMTSLGLIALVLFVSGCFRSFTMTGLSTLGYSDLDRNEMPERDDAQPGRDAAFDRVRRVACQPALRGGALVSRRAAGAAIIGAIAGWRWV